MHILNKKILHLFPLVQGLSQDKEFVSESLLSRLQDDDPAIVSCVLKLGQVCILTGVMSGIMLSKLAPS